jgi:hypothetical protein
MKRKYYILYKTTNLKNNKFYIGVHETNNLNDGYLGSGKKFKNSLYYHGKENFKLEILEYFDNSKKMYQRELEVVNEELLKNPKCLNLKLGGEGGWPTNSGDNWKHANEYWKHPDNKKRLSKIIGERSKRIWNNLSEKQRKNRLLKLNFTNKNHSEETKKKIGLKNSINQKGIKNSQYGTCWITNEKINKKIYRGDEIPKGFRLGRKVKILN